MNDAPFTALQMILLSAMTSRTEVAGFLAVPGVIAFFALPPLRVRPSTSSTDAELLGSKFLVEFRVPAFAGGALVGPEL